MTTLVATEITSQHWIQDVLSIRSWKSVIVITLFLNIWFSAFAVVYSTYETRQTFAELHTLRQQHDGLFSEWTQLLLEQSAWTDAASVQEIAELELAMHFPTTKDTQFLVVAP